MGYLAKLFSSRQNYKQYCKFFTVIFCFCIHQFAYSATPGLPFSEDFSAFNLRDSDKTTARWSVIDGELTLESRGAQAGGFLSGNPPSNNIWLFAEDTSNLQVADFDGDGNLDVMADNGIAEGNHIYFGTSSVADFENITPHRFGTGAELGDGYVATAAIGDLNNDGLIDVVESGTTQIPAKKYFRYYLNDGTGTPFTTATATFEVSFSGLTNLADINNDGFLDAIISTGDAIHLYLNTTNPNTPFVSSSPVITGLTDNTRDAVSTP